MLFVGLGLIIGAFVVCSLLTLLVRRVARQIDFLDHPDQRKTHREPVAYGGGLAIFLTVALAFLGGLFLARIGQAAWLPGRLQSFLNAHGPGLLSQSWSAVSILIGGGVLVVVGLIDDRRGLPAWLKLAVQILVAAGMVWAGHRVTIFVAAPWIGMGVTVLWIVGITNAFNFLDNMDGLSAGVALVIAGIFAVVAFATGQLFVGSALLVLSGALAGFLLFNFKPASIFMGDAGSLFIGFILAVLTVDHTFYGTGIGASPWYVLVMPLALFAVPIYDVTSVTVMRLARGQSPWQADRSHFSHRLVRRGLTDTAAVGVIYLATLITGGTLLVLVLGPAWALVQTVGVLGLLAILEHISRPEAGNRE